MFIRVLLLVLAFVSSALAQDDIPQAFTTSATEYSTAEENIKILNSQNLGEVLSEFSKEELNAVKVELLPIATQETYVSTRVYIGREEKVACTICVADDDIECGTRKTQEECSGAPAAGASSGGSGSDGKQPSATAKPPVDEQGFNRCFWSPASAQYSGSSCVSLRQDCCRKTCQGAEKPHQCFVISGRATPTSAVSASIVDQLVREKTDTGGPCDRTRTNVYFTGHGSSDAYQFATVTACDIAGSTHTGCQTFGLTSSSVPSSPWISAMEWAMAQAKNNKTINVCGNQMSSLNGNLCHVAGGRICVKVTSSGEIQTTPGQCFNTSSTSVTGDQCAFGANEIPYAYCSTSPGDGYHFYRNRLGCQKCEVNSVRNGISFGHWVPVEVSQCCNATKNIPKEYCEVETVMEGSFDFHNYWGCCVDGSRPEAGTYGDAHYAQITGGRCPGSGVEKRKDLLGGGTRPLSRQECRDENGYCCKTAEGVTKVNSVQQCSGTVPFPSDIPASVGFCPRTKAQQEGDPQICCDNAIPSSATGFSLGYGNRAWLRESQCKEKFHASDCSKSCYEAGANPGCCKIPGVSDQYQCENSAAATCCSFNGSRSPVYLYENDCKRLGGVSANNSVCLNSLEETKDLSKPKICCHTPVYGNSPGLSTITVPKYIPISQCLAETGNSGFYTPDEARCLATSPMACCQRGERKAWESAAGCSQATSAYPAGRILTFVVSEAVCRGQ